MSFFKWFRKKNEKPEEVGKSDKGARSLYLHEDDYCQAELVPRENSMDLKETNEKIDEFAQKHSEGIGFTDMYIREGHKFNTSERKIPIEEFESLLQKCGFQKISKIYSVFGSYKELCDETWGFTLDASTVFCEFKNDRIQNIWIIGFRFNQSSNKKEQLVNGLFALGEKWNLVLNDWNLTETIDLMNKTEIEAYIS